ncbi:DUF29 family protein [Paraburkholderia nemoris]|uniref:DUF29 family protein n=1 Tax=Paraburkholderia nemoris TaxID=2793076 RepID=UPI0038B7D342
MELARFPREGRFDLQGIEHLADEIEDVGKTELQVLVKQISVLLAYLLMWHCLPDERTGRWSAMIELQRSRIGESLEESPSLRAKIDEPGKLLLIWTHPYPTSASVSVSIDEKQSFPFPAVAESKFDVLSWKRCLTRWGERRQYQRRCALPYWRTGSGHAPAGTQLHR